MCAYARETQTECVYGPGLHYFPYSVGQSSIGHILTTRKAGNIFWLCLLEDEDRFGDELLDYASASQT